MYEINNIIIIIIIISGSPLMRCILGCRVPKTPHGLATLHSRWISALAMMDPVQRIHRSTTEKYSTRFFNYLIWWVRPAEYFSVGYIDTHAHNIF